ncbi:glycoside hydrolase family 13 protein [Thermoplasma volcanium]|nr:glycoside hydrolase family 13 protein [Thermoplasma volcanium]
MVEVKIIKSDGFFNEVLISSDKKIHFDTAYAEGDFNCFGEGSIVSETTDDLKFKIANLIPGKYHFKIAIDQYKILREAENRSGSYSFSIWLEKPYHNPDYAQFCAIIDKKLMDVRIAVPKHSISVSIFTKDTLKPVYSRRASFDTFDAVEYVFDGMSDYYFEVDNSRLPKEGYFSPKVHIEHEGGSKIIYHIFPDRFFRVGPHLPTLSRWGDKPTFSSFFGGNLRGITEKIGYIKALNVDTIYLNPVYKSKSNHRYDVDDYFSIDGLLGGEQDFIELVNEAHENGIKIVADMVFNHTSTDFPYFLDALKNGKNSKYWNWYIFHGEGAAVFDGRAKGKTKPLYETFMGVGRMPKLNHKNAEVRKFCIDVMKYYKNKFGVDGFRYDVAHSIYPEFFLEAVKEFGNEMLHIGEAWCLPSMFMLSGYWNSFTNYYLRNAIIKFVREEINITEFYNMIQNMIISYGPLIQQNVMNILDSHDTERILRAFKGNKKKVKLAYSILFMFDGFATIYYGDEVGLDGGRDPDDRRCFPWDNMDEDMLQFLKKLGEIRRMYHTGSAGIITVEETQECKYITRLSGESIIKVAIAKKPVTLEGEIILSSCGEKTIYEGDFALSIAKYA